MSELIEKVEEARRKAVSKTMRELGYTERDMPNRSQIYRDLKNTAAIRVVLEELIKEHEGYDGVIFYIKRFAEEHNIKLPNLVK